jgi:hypothetical protein
MNPCNRISPSAPTPSHQSLIYYLLLCLQVVLTSWVFRFHHCTHFLDTKKSTLGDAKLTMATESKASRETVTYPTSKDREYLTGLKLVLTLGSLALVTFLVLLDSSIIGTVSQCTHYPVNLFIVTYRLYLALPPNSAHFQTSVGTSVHTRWHGTISATNTQRSTAEPNH